MEWVETTGRTVEEAKELALDQLGVVADEADFEVLSEPKQGLFGRVRGEARVRARVRPAPVRPKQDRRRGRKSEGGGNAAPTTTEAVPTTNGHDAMDTAAASDDVAATGRDSGESPVPTGARRGNRRGGRGRSGGATAPSTDATVSDDNSPAPDTSGGSAMTTDERPEPTVADVESVRAAAVTFVGGLSTAFGFEANVDAAVDGSEIEVRVTGESLGLLIGPAGRTLLAIQDLTRVAAQRRLGDHDTRLRVDVAGYREKRREALERFAVSVADQVKESGVARSLDPMPSADRKVLHDALGAIEGVTSRSEGEDPNRRVVVTPA